MAAVVGQMLPRLNSARVVAICDPDRDRTARRLKDLDLQDVRHFGNARSLVQDPAVQWVFVGSTNNLHAEHICLALEAGKHVFCEKPLCVSLDECERVQRAVARSEARLALGFVLRYSPHYQKVKRLLEQGTCGQIISFEFNETLAFNHGGYILADWRRLRRFAGTALLEKCCHDIDLACWLVGSRPTHVASFGGLAFFTPRNAHHMDRLGTNANGRRAYQAWESTTGLNPFNSDKDTEDHQVVIFEFENGVRATFHMNFHAAIPERRMYFCGTEGALRANVVSGQIQAARVGFNETIRDESLGVTDGHGGGDEMLGAELADMIEHDAPPRASFAEGMISTVASLGIDEAMRNRTVVDLRPTWQKLDLLDLGQIDAPRTHRQSCPS